MREIPLTRGKVALVDDEDVPIVASFRWQATPASNNKDGSGIWYATCSVWVREERRSHTLRMHRVLVGASGEEIVDHIDGDGLNNTKKNLRKGTQSQNCVNRKTTPGPYLRGTSPKHRKWRADLKYQGLRLYLGYFDTEQEAHAAYLAEAKRIHGDWVPSLPIPPVSA